MNIPDKAQEVMNAMKQEKKNGAQTHDSVTLVAVSKRQPALAVQEALQAGIVNFGENYLQEALPKMAQLQSARIIWHFIGTLQTNKAKRIAEHFSWVHTVCTIKQANCLNKARPLNLPPLNVCIEINLDNEEGKSGTTPEEALPLAAHILTLPRLKLRGIMVLPKPTLGYQSQLQSFLRAQALLQSLRDQLNAQLDTLSMGTSQDYLAAIEAGSTMVRIGEAIFGQREPKDRNASLKN